MRATPENLSSKKIKSIYDNSAIIFIITVHEIFELLLFKKKNRNKSINEVTPGTNKVILTDLGQEMSLSWCVPWMDQIRRTLQNPKP